MNSEPRAYSKYSQHTMSFTLNLSNNSKSNKIKNLLGPIDWSLISNQMKWTFLYMVLHVLVLQFNSTEVIVCCIAIDCNCSALVLQGCRAMMLQCCRAMVLWCFSTAVQWCCSAMVLQLLGSSVFIWCFSVLIQ